MSPVLALLLLALLPASAAAAEHTVTMAGLAYAPARIEARVGDTLTFVNDDGLDHNVFVPTRGFGVDLGAQKPGATTRLPLGKPGTFEVECVIHPHMLLTVSVGK